MDFEAELPVYSERKKKKIYFFVKKARFAYCKLDF